MTWGAVTQLTGVLRDRIAGYRGGRAKAEMASRDAESNEKSIVVRSIVLSGRREDLRRRLYTVNGRREG